MPPGPVRSHSMPVVAAVGAVLLLGAASGCAASSGDGEASGSREASGTGEPSGTGQPPCYPPSFSVTPPTAKPGERVTVTAADADCNPRYGDNARIRVTVRDAASVQVLDATAPMNDAGGFSYTFEVPAQTAVGDAAVTAMPHNIDWCDDTGRNNRARGAAVTLHRASCAEPMKPLSITR